MEETITWTTYRDDPEGAAMLAIGTREDSHHRYPLTVHVDGGSVDIEMEYSKRNRVCLDTCTARALANALLMFADTGSI